MGLLMPLLSLSVLVFGASQQCAGQACDVDDVSMLQGRIHLPREGVMLNDDADELSPPGPGPPRYTLHNVRRPLLTNRTQEPYNREPNKCQSQSPDGRIYLCGEAKNYIRYFKFESLTFYDDGVPKFDDSTWSLWPDHVKDADSHTSTLCWPDWNKPFEVIQGGAHSYTFFIFDDDYRQSVTVVVAHPMTPNATIISVSGGPHERMSFVSNPDNLYNDKLPKYHSFSGDGRLVIGRVPVRNWTMTYQSLPSDAQACAREGWSAPKLLHELPHDADLASRYGVAKFPMKDSTGVPFSRNNKIIGGYAWLDPEARNLWFSGWRVIGEDTHGIEVYMNGGMNQDYSRSRFMSSPMWNFESERTRAQRFPGELHTSGVGSGSNYQLPMSKGHHVLPVFAAWQEFYTEAPLFEEWKAAQFDMLYLTMAPVVVQAADRQCTGPLDYDRCSASKPIINKGQDDMLCDGGSEFCPSVSDIPPLISDISGNFLSGEMRGDAKVQYNWTTRAPNQPQGLGFCMRMNRGAAVVNLTRTPNVRGIASPIPSFTAQLAIHPWSTFDHGTKWALHHPQLELSLRRGQGNWRVNGVQVAAGSFRNHGWTHYAVVFDGVDQSLTSFRNGVQVATVAVQFSEMQLDGSSPLIIGNAVTENFEQWGPTYRGVVDEIRLMSHARSQRNLCKAALGADCGGSISYHPTATQFQLTRQHPQCTPAAMHTFACVSAIHKVCANHVAQLMKAAGSSNDALGALTPPGPPVSMAGALVAMNGNESAQIACSPFADHLSVPVEWRLMNQYDSRCRYLTDHSDESTFCNLAAHVFCEAARPGRNVAQTGLVFEVDARAWVSCFDAEQVLVVNFTTAASTALSPCAQSPGAVACHEAASSACAAEGHDAGVVQKIDATMAEVHCFNAPSVVATANGGRGPFDFRFGS